MQSSTLARIDEDKPVPEPDPRIAQAASGDRAAADSLVRELMPRVRNLVRYLVQGDSDVDDIAQIALVAVLRGLPTFRAEGSFKSWTDRIVVRETLAFVKRRRARDARRHDASVEVFVVDSTARSEAYAMRRKLVRCLDAIPEEQREVVVLHHVLGLSMPEVAEEVGVPFETARSRHRLGMGKLRTLINEIGGEQ
jgi:RNA polymerase sigma-70 factor (ECF subfamily)